MYIKSNGSKKALTFRPRHLFPTILKRWLQSFDLHSLCSTNRLVCNFLSSSVGFNPCNCFFPTRLCLLLSFLTFSRLSIPQLSLLPFLFLTSAVSAFFRPLQFWILTTQPLFFLSFSSRVRLTVASPVPDSALASSVSPFSPA